MKKFILFAGLIVVFGTSAQEVSSVSRQRTPVILELFTSEGCSSCPPADRLLESLDERQPFAGADLVVLSEHVDYWNSGGWVDPYSSHLFSDRQNEYARQLSLDDVYTPQVVVDGQQAVVGSDAIAIKNAVAKALRSEKAKLTVSNVVREGDSIKLRLTSTSLSANNVSGTLYVAIAQNKAQSNVARGENGGRSLTHVAVVRVLIPVGSVKAGSSFSKDLVIPIPSQIAAGGLRVVAFLQDDKTHKIVGATLEKI